MQEEIEIAPFDNLLVFKKGYTPEFVAATIRERKLGGLRVFAVLKDQRPEDLHFLANYPFLEKLDVTAGEDYDFSFLEKLPGLVKLSIKTAGKRVIDLSHQKKLLELSLLWRKQITGLQECSQLKSLSLNEFNEPDLSRVGIFPRLTELKIKTAAITSLNGIRELKALQYLLLANCKKLTYVSAMNGLEQLKELELDTCPRVEDYAGLLHLPALEKLTFTGCKKLASIKFIENFPALEEFSLTGNTEVADNDLVPAKRIRSVFYNHLPTYNTKIENKGYEENIRQNLLKIKNLFKGKS